MGRRFPQAAPAPAYTNVAAAEHGAKIEKSTSQYENSWAAKHLLEADQAAEDGRAQNRRVELVRK